MKKLLSFVWCLAIAIGIMSISAQAAGTVISDAEVNVITPVDGHTPSFAATIPDEDTDKYEVKSVVWKKGTVELTENDKFQKGETYSCTVSLVVKGDYVFDNKRGESISPLYIKINDEAAGSDCKIMSDNVTITKKFYCYADDPNAVIKEFTITGLKMNVGDTNFFENIEASSPGVKIYGNINGDMVWTVLTDILSEDDLLRYAAGELTEDELRAKMNSAPEEDRNTFAAAMILYGGRGNDIQIYNETKDKYYIITAGTPLLEGEKYRYIITPELQKGYKFADNCVVSVPGASEVTIGDTKSVLSYNIYFTPTIATDGNEITVTGGNAVIGTSVEATKAHESAMVTITAATPAEEKEFDRWVVVSGDVTIADPTSATTTFIMSSKDVKIEATYKEHTWKDVEILEAATYEKDGSKKVKCETCGITAVHKIDKLVCTEHSWKDDKVLKEASYQEEGLMQIICEKCGKTDEKVIPQLLCTEHKWTDSRIIQAPTSNSSGKKEIKCEVCGETKTVEVSKIVKGATFADTACGICVKVNNAKNKTVSITKAINKNSTEIVIPKTIVYEGVTYKVNEIADKAFANNKKLKTVTIGTNITSIGSKAFYKCTSLKSVVIPTKVTKIGSYAFYGCKNLKKVQIKTDKLTDKKIGAKAFTSINSKAVVTVSKKKYTSYKKLLKKKGITKKTQKIKK